VNEHAFRLRARLFPWTLPYRVRRVLGIVGLAWVMFWVWALGLLMGSGVWVAGTPEVEAWELWVGTALHFTLGLAAMSQMPRRTGAPKP
jgi:hypothetical protein